eukprot:3700450-Rhodomonas_salina.7
MPLPGHGRTPHCAGELSDTPQTIPKKTLYLSAAYSRRGIFLRLKTQFYLSTPLFPDALN